MVWEFCPVPEDMVPVEMTEMSKRVWPWLPSNGGGMSQFR